jgi:hypothetical protein
MSANIPLHVIPEPNRNGDSSFRSVFSFPDGKLPLLTGDYGSPNLACGSCGAVLAVGLPLNQFESTSGNIDIGDGRSRKHISAGLKNVKSPSHISKEIVVVTPNGLLVVVCPKCGAFNELLRTLVSD